MSAKPSDFFVGAMELFAILLPGAILAFYLGPWAGRQVFGPVLPALTTPAEHWVAFAVCSYVFGHLLHAVGSVTADPFYDRVFVRRKRRGGEEKLLAKTRALMARDLGEDRDVTSAFDWAGSYVRLRSDAAALELERGGGDSKFFRSLFLVAVMIAAIQLVGSDWEYAGLSFAVAGFSLYRFCQRRWQTAQRTYEYFVLLRLAAADDADAPDNR